MLATIRSWKRPGRDLASVTERVTPATLWLFTSGLQNCIRISSVALWHPGCGTLLQQPEQTRRDSKDSTEDKQNPPDGRGVVTMRNRQCWLQSSSAFVELSVSEKCWPLHSGWPSTSGFPRGSVLWPFTGLGSGRSDGVGNQSGGCSYFFKEKKAVPQNADGMLVLVKQTNKINKTCCSISEGRTYQNDAVWWKNCIWNMKRKWKHGT